MRFAVVLGFTALLGLHSSVAQNATPAPRLRIIELPAQTPACPINMRVRQGVSGKMTRVQTGGTQPQAVGARVKLLLKDAHAYRAKHQMMSATVSVRGLDGTAHLLPVNTLEDGPGDTVKTLTVQLAGDEDQQVSSDLVLPGLTSVSMVVLESVTYDDGTTWKFGEASACHAAPDLLVPVSGN